MRICVFTAIYGGYDTLLQPARQTVPTDFLCFTDAAGPRRNGAWRMIQSDILPQAEPRRRAKYFKIRSHQVFPGGVLAPEFRRWPQLSFRSPRYDAVIWIDGCLRIKDPRFAESFAAHIGKTGWAMFTHPDRDCIYDELPEAAAQKKCWGLPLAEQVGHYRAEGYPPHRGLLACTLIARDPRNAQVARLNEAWWAQIERWSIRDQLSLPFVLWRHGGEVDRVNLNLWNNPWFDRLEHHSDL